VPAGRGRRTSRRRRTALGYLLAVLAGPLVLLVLPMRIGVASLVASLILSGSILTAAALPRALRRRMGRVGGLLVTMVVLGLAGTLLAVISEQCSFWGSSCRAEIGGWTLTWMLLPVAWALFGLLVVGGWRSGSAAIGVLRRRAGRFGRGPSAGAEQAGRGAGRRR